VHDVLALDDRDVAGKRLPDLDGRANPVLAIGQRAIRVEDDRRQRGVPFPAEHGAVPFVPGCSELAVLLVGQQALHLSDRECLEAH
jgi:hypothetical protein